MIYLYVFIAGVIQGLTEFLPISSSGHLVLLHDFFSFDFIDNLTFDVVLHLGTLIALLLFFWADICRYLKAFFQSFIHWETRTNLEQRLSWYFLIATIPALLVGYFLEDYIEQVLRNFKTVALMLIIFGIILYLADKYSLKTKDLSEVTFSNALLIGLAQVLALIPGVSRSGITIIAGLSQKLKRETAARFSFLLSLPAVLAAGTKKLVDLSGQGISSTDFLILIVGFVASALTGYFCIKYFLKFLQSHSLKLFAYYRIILGIIILVILLI